MVDILSREKRSALMASVRTVGTKPEMRVRRVAYSCGLRYRIAPRGVRGRPDLSFSGARIAVFVHGCFWHGHEGCRKAKLPTTNSEFWAAKIQSNQRRDIEIQSHLIADGWRHIVIWECETKNYATIVERLAPVITHYRGSEFLSRAIEASIK
ncbi:MULTISPECIES: very short patch repair endonuclease [Azospirillum]|uniref:Very short patch repair endonuclease n=1 Tax=Azospirillum lipoferum TaxID=193 RepID=A0A5A9GDW7_AZOLI|nr:DNA mismatch endonuclease Vsr [Azospirillum lipoferum]